MFCCCPRKHAENPRKSKRREEDETYLGFDLSTQAFKVVQLNFKLETLTTANLNYEADLPEFQTKGGVVPGTRENEFFGQPIMWVKALDKAMDLLVKRGADLSTVVAIGGSAQQHGSVYWSRKGIEILQNLDPSKSLHAQLNDSAFVLTRTPIWMDASTEKQCAEMEKSVGGKMKMVAITGSKCYARFTGPQIRKIYQLQPDDYSKTERISLVSSFFASIFIGKKAPIDYADASGMNLFNIKEKVWSKACLNACAPELETKLGQPVPTNYIIGNVCNYFVKRYGFSPACKVSAFTGDNPSALSGMLVEENWIALSLGTSDTVLMNLQEPTQLEEGHVLCHPTNPEQFMGLLCFRNGALVREAFRKSEANDNWDTFNEYLKCTPPGNDGDMALHFNELEIIPNVKGTLRWSEHHNCSCIDANEGVQRFQTPQIEVRALIEGQVIHKRTVAADMGFHFGKDTKIIATGGASVNEYILKIVSDIFNAPVYIQKNSEAALMGAAFRAKYVHYVDKAKQRPNDIPKITSFRDYIIQYIPNYSQKICEPNDSQNIYMSMFDRYREMVEILKKRQ